MSNEKLITDLYRQGEEELALIYRENLKAKEAERISPYFLIFDKDGNPNFKYDRSSRLGEMEHQGMMTMRELSLDGAKYMVWLSPPGGVSNYTEGRLVVGKVIKNTGGVVIECRGIPLLKNREEFGKIIERLGEDLEVEDLRRWAIEIDVDNDQQFWDYCQQIFGNKEVWDYIRQGKDIVNKKKTERVILEVLLEMKIIGMDQPGDFEGMMRRRGFNLMAGNHGGLNRPGDTRVKSAFDQLFLNSEMVLKAEKIDGKLICPCGEVLKEGETRCPKCGLKLINVNDL